MIDVRVRTCRSTHALVADILLHISMIKTQYLYRSCSMFIRSQYHMLLLTYFFWR